MATYVTLTIPVEDILGDDYDPRRTSVWIEANTPGSLIVVDGTSLRIGGRREKVTASTIDLANLVATNSADNPTSFEYRVTFVYTPQGGGRQQTLTTSTFPLTASANLAAIDAAWDDITAPPSWRSDFLDQAQELLDQQEAIADIDDTDTAVAYALQFGPEAAPYLSNTYATRASLKGEGSAPSGVGARAGRFDPSRSLYLPAGVSMSSLRAAVAKGQIGAARSRLYWLGTSIVAGRGSVTGVSDPVVVLRNLLGGTNTTSGLVGTTNGNPGDPDDSRMTYTPADWLEEGAPRTGFISFYRKVGATAKTFTYTSDLPGTVVDIVAFGNSASFSYSIDGGATATFTRNGLSAPQTVSVAGLANTTHTVTITTVSATYVYLVGIGVRQAKGLEVSAWGYYGASTWDFTQTTQFYHARNVINALDPDVVLVQLGANEAIHGLGAVELETNLGTMVAAHKAAGRQVLLIVDPPIEDGLVTNWATTFRSSIYDVADAQGVPLLDLTDAWTNRTAGAALGYYSDQYHNTPAGAAAIASAVHAALIPT